MIENVSSQLARWITSSPKRSLVLCFLFLALCIPGTAFIQMDFEVDNWFKKDDELLLNYNFFRSTFGNDDSIMLAATHSDGIFKPSNLKLARDLTEDLWKIPTVVRVDSLTNFNLIEAAGDDILVEELVSEKFSYSEESIEKLIKTATEHNEIPGQFLSYDGNSFFYMIRLKPRFGEKQNFDKVVHKLYEILGPYENKGFEFHTVGTARVTQAFKQIAEKDLMTMIPILNILISILLFLIFRSFYGVLLPFCIIGTTVGTTMGVSGYLGIQLNNLSGMVPNILIAICISDSIHILNTFRRLQDKPDAYYLTLKKNIFPIFLTSVSTMIGFLSLVFNDLVPVQNFGVLCALGCIFAWFFSCFGIIPILQISKYKFAEKKGLNFDWLSIPLSKYTSRFSGVIISFFFILTLAGITIASQNEVNSNPFLYFSEDTDLYQSNQYMLDKFKGFNGLEIIVDSGEEHGAMTPDFLKKIAEYKRWIESLDYVNTTISVVPIHKSLNQAFKGGQRAAYKIPESKEEVAQHYLFYTMGLPMGVDMSNFLDISERYLRLTVLWNIQNSKQSLQETQRIERKSEEFGLKVFATGQEYLFQGMNSYVVKGYFVSIGLSIVLIGLLIAFILKSWSYTLLSLFPNIVAISSGAMAMQILGKPLDVGTVLVASICFGIAIDDTTHFLVEYNANRKKGISLNEAIELTLKRTGSSLIITSIILCASFSVFIFADFMPNFNFGVFSAFVLMVALITDLLLLPAVLKRWHH